MLELRRREVKCPGSPAEQPSAEAAADGCSADSIRLRHLIGANKDAIYRVLQDSSVAEAYLFGSVARGTANADSDIDIFVVCRPELSDIDAYLTTGALIDSLSEILETSVDVLAQVIAKPEVLSSAGKDLIPLDQIT